MLDEMLMISVNLRLEKARACLIASEKLFMENLCMDSANRSYYCIFHAIRAALITKGFASKKHSGNIAEFRRKYVKTGLFPAEFSDIIGSAFEVRNNSDYNDFYVISKSDVSLQLENARIFLAAVEAYIRTL